MHNYSWLKAYQTPLEKARECIGLLEKRIVQQKDVEVFLKSLKQGSHERVHKELHEIGKSIIHIYTG